VTKAEAESIKEKMDTLQNQVAGIFAVLSAKLAALDLAASYLARELIEHLDDTPSPTEEPTSEGNN
jgi:hypothetical protein